MDKTIPKASCIENVPALGEELGTQIKVEKFLEGSRIVVTGISA